VSTGRNFWFASCLCLFVAATSGCKPESKDDQLYSVRVHVTNKAGASYPGIVLAIQIGDNNLLETADGNGDVIYSLPESTYSLISGGALPTRSYVYAESGEYEASISVSSGVSTYTAIFREVVYVDMSTVTSSGTTPPITTQKKFAAAFTLASQTDFCSAGLGVYFGPGYVPPGTQISIHADNSGQPNSTATFISSDVTDLDVMIKEFIPNWDISTAGLTGNFCDSSNSVRTLNAGTYWIVATFPSAPSACVSGRCFHVVGKTNLGSSGLPVLVSSDGGATWNSHSFTAGGESRQSLVTFLTE
jgi:hypothetical protein